MLEEECCYYHHYLPKDGRMTMDVWVHLRSVLGLSAVIPMGQEQGEHMLGRA